MTIGELTKYLEVWAPPGAAWDKDNVGLQIGSRGIRLKNIMLSLELTPEVLKEASTKKCNIIITHHPLIFNPIKKLDTEKDSQAKLIEQLIKKNISVYSAHTNLDSVKDGVSFELAKTLKLTNIKFLENDEGKQIKFVVFVPAENLDAVASAVFNAGAGIIGEYENCGFRLNGEGTFKGSEKSNPVIGKKQKLEKVNEVRLEFIAEAWNLNKTTKALLEAHPYDEPAYDIYPLKNKNVNYGAGAIGELNNEMSEHTFLAFVNKTIKTNGLRYCSGKNKPIKKVAVCGGSGSDLLKKAVDAGADAFVTADIKYHTYHDAIGKILLIDAGHYETEIFALNALKRKIENLIPQTSRIKIYKYSKSTNPVKFYKH